MLFTMRLNHLMALIALVAAMCLIPECASAEKAATEPDKVGSSTHATRAPAVSFARPADPLAPALQQAVATLLYDNTFLLGVRVLGQSIKESSTAMTKR